MANIVVTGAAGFVGSHLSEQLIARGHTVTGIDAFIPYYPRALKERNLICLLQDPNFRFHEADLRSADVRPLLEGADAVFHLAAMAGLLRSWQEFDDYMTCNVLATQRLLEAARDTPDPPLPPYLHIVCLRPICDRRRDFAPRPHLALRHHQARRRASVPGLRRKLRPARHHLAPLLRVRPAPAPGHGLQHLHPLHPAGRADHRRRRRQRQPQQYLRGGLRAGSDSRF